jgi:uncharacterized protein (TIGR00251 family)
MSPLVTKSANERTVVFPVYVVPRAAKNEIVGVEGETLKVRVTAPPVKGKANEALVRLLAKTLGLRKNQVEIVAGHRARHKMVRAAGIDENAVLDLLRRRRDKR